MALSETHVRKNFAFIVDSLIPAWRQVLDYLFQEEVIDSDAYDDIFDNTELTSDKSRKIVKKVLNSSSHTRAAEFLGKALIKYGCEFVLEEISLGPGKEPYRMNNRFWWFRQIRGRLEKKNSWTEYEGYRVELAKEIQRRQGDPELEHLVNVYDCRKHVGRGNAIGALEITNKALSAPCSSPNSEYYRIELIGHKIRALTHLGRHEEAKQLEEDGKIRISMLCSSWEVADFHKRLGAAYGRKTCAITQSKERECQHEIEYHKTMERDAWLLALRAFQQDEEEHRTRITYSEQVRCHLGLIGCLLGTNPDKNYDASKTVPLADLKVARSHVRIIEDTSDLYTSMNELSKVQFLTFSADISHFYRNHTLAYEECKKALSVCTRRESRVKKALENRLVLFEACLAADQKEEVNLTELFSKLDDNFRN